MIEDNKKENNINEKPLSVDDIIVEAALRREKRLAEQEISNKQKESSDFQSDKDEFSSELELIEGNDANSEIELTKEKEEKEEKKRKSKLVYEWAEELFVAFAIVAVVFSFFFRVVTVIGTSMLPNFEGGDKLIVSCFLYNIDNGDVVVAVDILDDPIIKRVIANEGQTVDIDNGTGILYVDGEALDESEYNILKGSTFAKGADKLSFPLTVEKNCVFVLGDNRIVSKDSRFYEIGQISKDNILGKVEVRVYPFSEFKIIN